MTTAENQRNLRHIKAGFSLIEIVIALAIVAALGGIGFTAFRYLGRAKVTTTESKLISLNQAIREYIFDINKPPQQLEDLITRPQGVKRWKRAYVDDVDDFEDGWGNRFNYRVNPKGAEHPYELESEGDPNDQQAMPISVWNI